MAQKTCSSPIPEHQDRDLGDPFRVHAAGQFGEAHHQDVVDGVVFGFTFQRRVVDYQDLPRLDVVGDGPQHLADPEAYRRDRRKDLLLQESGYLVVRILTDDVSKRLSDVLDTLTHILVSRATRQ